MGDNRARGDRADSGTLAKHEAIHDLRSNEGVRPPQENALRAPQRIKYVEPVYPPRAKKAEVEGTVVLAIVIAPSGDVSDVGIIESVNRDLDRAAIEAVRQWKYETGDGPVSMKVTVGFNMN